MVNDCSAKPAHNLRRGSRHDCVSFGRRSGRAERVVCGRTGVGSSPAPSPAARVVAALSSRLRPGMPGAPVRRLRSPLAVTAHAFAPPARGLDFAPIAAIKPSRQRRLTPRRAAPALVAAALRRRRSSRWRRVAPPPAGSARRLRRPPSTGARSPRPPRSIARAILPGATRSPPRLDDPTERAAFDWLALRLAPHPTTSASPPSRAAHPHWPGEDWMRAGRGGASLRRPSAASVVAAHFAADPPTTPAGKLALARADLEAGRRDEATTIVARAVARQRSRRLGRSGDAQGFRARC